MGKTKLAALCLGGVLMIGGCGIFGHSDHGDIEQKEMITKSTVPSKVQRAFDHDYPGASVKKIKRETFKDGTMRYEFDYFLSGKQHKVLYSDQGEQLEMPEKH